MGGSFVYSVFLCLSASLISNAQDDLVGCGGFVISKYLGNFSRIKVNLYAKSGAIKYRTECAPSNGYFLIPLYDKGEYVLKVEPPDSWTFEPSEVSLAVDGKTDLCSRGVDINFNHIGFSLFGQVLSSGSESGPSGVTVSVTRPGDDGFHSETDTGEKGRFTVSGLPPGVYSLSPSHPLWKTGKGHVQSGGTPVAGVQLLLYSDTEIELECGSVSPPLPATSELDQPRCVVTSQEEGVFSFPTLPPSHFTLVPHYQHGQIVFDVHPSRLTFTITNDSLTIQPSFEVQGFTVSGRVLLSEQGEGVGGAQVFVNGYMTATTEEDGTYTLSNITSGSYHLLVEADRLEFEEKVVTITPSEPYLPDLTPVRAGGRQVKVVASEGDTLLSATTDQAGQFCVMLRPAHYSFSPEVSPAERGWGLVFAPPTRDLEVLSSPSSSLTFSQFTTSLSGTLSCLGTCPPSVTITLSQAGVQQVTTSTPSPSFTPSTPSSTPSSPSTPSPSSTPGLASFSFSSLLPGSVHVSLDYPLWCWEAETVTMEISPDAVPTLGFVQTGYAMSYTTSHDVTVLAAQVNETGTEYSLEKGSGRKCLTAPGLYTITPVSCHKFQLDQFGFTLSHHTHAHTHTHTLNLEP